jgi:hypothetical protein
MNMSAQVIAPEPPTPKPVVAGVFSIIVGAVALLVLSLVGILALVIGSVTLPVVGIVLAIIGIPLLALPTLALIGGIYAVQRRSWGLALAGSIAAALLSNVLGVASIVLVAVSKREFRHSRASC